jgi:hypothetical protein
MHAAEKSRLARPLARIAKGSVVRNAAVFVFALSSVMFCRSVSAQDLECSLGKITEHVLPHYPGGGVQGEVDVLATFAPDGHVSGNKVISGPQALRFEAQAYLNGWRAEPSSTPRQCVIHLKYTFDGSQACARRRNISVQAERVNETDVILHLGCDGF